MHHHKTFNSFLDKYLEVSFLLPTSHLNFLPICLGNLVFSVIPSHCDISSIAPLHLSQSHVICSRLSIFTYRMKQILLQSCMPLPLLFTAVSFLHCQAPQNYHLRPLSQLLYRSPSLRSLQSLKITHTILLQPKYMAP